MNQVHTTITKRKKIWQESKLGTVCRWDDFKALERHEERNRCTGHINYKVYHLLQNPKTFVNAYAKISKNKGSLTKGIKSDEEIMRFFGLEQANSIAKEFRVKAYQWKPGRRTWIPKPGKINRRPIDTPTQKDRIIQEAIRGILEAIYEPEFREFEQHNQRQCTNFGFRPNLSCWDAVENIRVKGKRSTYVIEGDIKQAYNNVNHNKLIQVLKRRIKDKRFLNLIQSMLKAGVMEGNQVIHSLKGTPQGGIVSPLLFNIYMFEMDKLVGEIIARTTEENHSNPKNNPVYGRIGRQIAKLMKLKYTLSAKEHRKQMKRLVSCRLKTPHKIVETLPKTMIYCRYADDWVILITGSRNRAELIKSKVQSILQEEFRMELDPVKTKISRIDQGIKFLGYKIRMCPPHKAKIMKVLVPKSNGKIGRVLKRLTSRTIRIVPDKERILKNAREKGFCRGTDYFPIAKASWVALEPHEMVTKFRQIMIGTNSYYAKCDPDQTMNRLQYILKFSCAKTLARRKKKGLSYVFNTYGKNLTICLNREKDSKNHEELGGNENFNYTISKHWRT